MSFKFESKATYTFPDSFSAYWIHFRRDKESTATNTLVYE